jgi:hypothetical protein
MIDEELVTKKIIPCLNEMYREADSLFDFTVDFEMIGQYAPVINGERKSVMGCFYLPKEKYDSILQKHTKGLETKWAFPYGHEDYKKGEEFEQLKKDYEANPDNEDLEEEYKLTVERMEHDKMWNEYCFTIQPVQDAYMKHKISEKEYRKREAKIAKECGFIQQSIEKDKVAFNVSGFSPNQNKEYFETVHNYYIAGAMDSLISDKTSQINLQAFEDAKAAIEFEKNCRTKNKTT